METIFKLRTPFPQSYIFFYKWDYYARGGRVGFKVSQGYRRGFMRLTGLLTSFQEGSSLVSKTFWRFRRFQEVSMRFQKNLGEFMKIQGIFMSISGCLRDFYGPSGVLSEFSGLRQVSEGFPMHLTCNQKSLQLTDWRRSNER